MPNKLYQKNKKYMSAYSIYHWFSAKSRGLPKKNKKRTNTPLWTCLPLVSYENYGWIRGYPTLL